MALMSSDRRNATIIAKVETTCLTLDRDDFNHLLGPLEKIMQDEAKRRASNTSNGNGFFSIVKSAFVRSQYKKNPKLSENPESNIKLSEFEVLEVAGKGRFGVVNAVMDPNSGKQYAMKVLEKDLLLESGLESHIFTIRDLCADVDHPFLPALYATYSDPTCLFQLNELVPGGDLWSLLV
jgi:hypothetical protein